MILSIENNEFSLIDIDQCSLHELLFAQYYQMWATHCLTQLCDLRWFDDTGCIDSGLL
jgi:hypothetical protein